MLQVLGKDHVLSSYNGYVNYLKTEENCIILLCPFLNLLTFAHISLS